MINTKIEALISLKPATEWTWLGDKYEDLNWLDSSTKPTEAELDAEVTRLNNLEPMILLRRERNESSRSRGRQSVRSSRRGRR